ncbi:hypothetical protein DPEC_G00230930 [Dallia pectoralis]|uniref:Uncharacterized protein n=1 Tax=Dallia pectoralis TaxID=75939 RepID=A0ACC2FWL0_DALPE|nr:hypothetical protein DPEC_G00230930 [Dallia pectoralis]
MRRDGANGFHPTEIMELVCSLWAALLAGVNFVNSRTFYKQTPGMAWISDEEERALLLLQGADQPGASSDELIHQHSVLKSLSEQWLCLITTAPAHHPSTGRGVEEGPTSDLHPERRFTGEYHNDPRVGARPVDCSAPQVVLPHPLQVQHQILIPAHSTTSRTSTEQ